VNNSIYIFKVDIWLFFNSKPKFESLINYSIVYIIPEEIEALKEADKVSPRLNKQNNNKIKNWTKFKYKNFRQQLTNTQSNEMK